MIRTGLLKLKRTSQKKYGPKEYVHCMYCQAMFVWRDLWWHIWKSLSKRVQGNARSGRTRVFSVAPMSESALCQQISQGVWKLLTVMKDGDISAAACSDVCILQLAQSFFNKHGQDPTKCDLIRQKFHEVVRLLLTTRREFLIHNLEDAVRPAKFHMVIQAVKNVSGFDEEKHRYQTPSLALKVGHSLQKTCDIIHCIALMAKWSELVSYTALTTLNEGHFNKPSNLAFTEDVQTSSPASWKDCRLSIREPKKDAICTSIWGTLQSSSGKNNTVQLKTWRRGWKVATKRLPREGQLPCIRMLQSASQSLNKNFVHISVGWKLGVEGGKKLLCYYHHTWLMP